jgi:ABC-type lipoprotein release transport system permease subunit
VIALAWRNLWRNKTRTLLTAFGIAFAVFLVSFAMAMQGGTYDDMIKAATRFYTGHAQINQRDFVTDGKLEQTVVNATALREQLQNQFPLVALPRVQGFGVVSKDERSIGGMLVGVDFTAEAAQLDLFKKISAGELPSAPDQALVGAAMARNLDAVLGDDIVILGSGKRGGVAAMALSISGILSTGQAQLDRNLLFASIEGVQEAFDLEDEVHELVLVLEDYTQGAVLAQPIDELLQQDQSYRTWQELLPEVEQGLELDRVSAELLYYMLLILVSFAVLNTFVMVIFERTREFGMLMALGLRPWQIIGQVQIEAFFLGLGGALMGLVLSTALVAYLSEVGIPLSAYGAGEEAAKQAMAQLQAGSITHLYPTFSVASVATAPLVLMVGTQLSALFCMLRVRRLNPVAALRVE